MSSSSSNGLEPEVVSDRQAIAAELDYLGRTGAQIPVSVRIWPLLLLVSLSGCGTLDRPESDPAPRFSNAIVVMIDTLRSDYLRSYGSGFETGPSLAALADRSIQLQGYAASSWTRPSVATFLTGLYPYRHGVLDRTDALAVRTPYLPEMLQKEGVETAAMVTNGNVSTLFGFSRGFDRFRLEIGSGKPSTDRAVPWALEVAKELEPPFFFYIHLMDPHTPYLPARIPASPELTYRDYIQPQQLLAGDVAFDSKNVNRLREQYVAEIQEMDPELETLFSGLDTLGLLEDTVVIVTSDHGEEFNEHGGLAHGQSLYEEVLRVPLIIWAKKGLAGYRSESRFHHVDFAPTILEALGKRVPEGFDGRSRWSSILAGAPVSEPDLLFHLDRGQDRIDALIRGRWKLIRRADSGDSVVYDLESDPGELQPFALESQDLRALERRLSERIRGLQSHRFEPAYVEPTYSVKEQLEALGYLDGN